MNPVTGFRPQDIRNLVLLGQSGSGKTTLVEALLHHCGAITRMGSVEEANTTSDFEPEARSHRHSTGSTLLFATCQGKEFNIIDTPGHPDFIGSALAALAAVETAILVVDAVNGLAYHTRRLFHAAGEMGLARMVVINKIDENPAALASLVAQLKEAFGAELHPINLPCRQGRDVLDCFDHEAGEADFGRVADVHREMLESTIEVDDAEVEKYFAGQRIDLGELRACFIKAMSQGHVVPILFTSAKNEVGIDDLLHILAEEGPSPVTGRPRRLRRGGELVEVPCDAEQPFLAHVFKVTADPYVGKLAMLRILQGRLDANTPFICGADKKPHKATHLLKVEGRDHPELSTVAFAGDLVAVAKLEDLHVGQILHAPGLPEDYAPVLPRYPEPMLALAVEARNKSDEVKLGTAMQRLVEEDPTLKARQDPQTREFVLSGLGELHLRVALERFVNRFHLEVVTKPPKVAYRETVSSQAEGHYRLKKQTGGAGQFAEVFLRVEPLPRGSGFEFKSEVFGGAIPTHYIPAVEKGVQDALEAGVLAGFPIQDVRVVVHDGKSHPVDSKDIVFRTAGKWAFRDAVAHARAVLLEPIMSLELTVPEEHLGAVTADLKTRRGRVSGIDTLSGGQSVVHAQVPLEEVGNLGSQLRGATGGRGSFVMELSHYDVVPQGVEGKITARYQPRHEEE